MDLPSIAHPASLMSHEVLDDHGLRILLEERSGLGPVEPDPVGLDFTTREIVSGPDDGIYEILWPVVVCFAVRGDPFPVGEASTSTISELGCDSPFLRWVKSESHAAPDYVAIMGSDFDDSAQGSELRHWVISSNEARFDVAAIAPPHVVRLPQANGS